MSLDSAHVKEEPEWEPESEAAARAGLYAGHDVTHELKIELELEPDLIQPQDILYPMQGLLKHSKDIKDVGRATVPGDPFSGETFPMSAPRPSSDSLDRILDDNKPHYCKSCHSTFALKSRLLSHPCVAAKKANSKKEKHKICNTEIQNYSCDYCKNEFVDKSHLIDHIKMHMFDKPYACEVCNKLCKTFSSLKRHSVVHETETSTHSEKQEDIHSEKSHSCQICGKQLSRKTYLVNHMRILSGQKPFSCIVCNKQFRYRSNLVSHERIHPHMEKTSFPCVTCKKQFRDKHELVRHKAIHSAEKSYSCQICGKQQLSRKCNLVNHMRIHSRQKPFTCQICNKEYPRKGDLNRHTLAHAEWTTHRCEICKKLFSRISTLAKHMKRHTSLKELSCRLCNAQFQEKSSLVAHERVHKREESFSCETFNKQFEGKRRLLQHKASHAEMHSCEVCGLQFTRKPVLISHMRTHAEEESLPSEFVYNNIPVYTSEPEDYLLT